MILLRQEATARRAPRRLSGMWCRAFVVLLAIMAWLLLAQWLVPEARAQEIHQRPLLYSMEARPCYDTADIIKRLGSFFNETSRGGGVTENGYLVRLYRSDKTFTILISKPGGFSCYAATGLEWIDIAPEISGDKT